ncbi:MAG: symmetrical bis(5'-nucleosyl)-tetraphosphatase [Gammaproteobacteria bacterium]|nr:symmetrical bis(5'-nucleosyl)-tetraphosphatase [Gammaproteobacteria bacterium]
MSTYAIGDIQGCCSLLKKMLEHVHFDPAKDKLWLVGDLVNRGPMSLEVLRFVRELNDCTTVVLGNHDMQLLAAACGNLKHAKAKDTIGPILEAPDRDGLTHWLRHRPLLHHDETLGYTMVHAGLPPQWDFAQAMQCARELEEILRGPGYMEYFQHHVFGKTPNLWSENLQGWERIRFISACFTRMRYVDRQGGLSMKKKYAPYAYTDDEYPWFMYPNRASQSMRILFGHWASLGFYSGNGVYGLDTGCLWGGSLTALRLEDKQIFQLPCPQLRKPK